MKVFKHVNNLWNDSEVIKLSGIDRLVYRSNKLGSDQRITNTGGSGRSIFSFGLATVEQNHRTNNHR